MAGQLADEVGILHLLIEVAHKAAPSEVAARYVAYRVLFLFPGGGVNHRDHSSQPCKLKHLFDVDVILLLGGQRKQFVARGVLVPLDNFGGDRIQRHAHSYRSTVFGLSRYILHGAIDDIALSHRP